MKKIYLVLVLAFMLGACKAPVQFRGLSETNSKIDLIKRHFSVSSKIKASNSSLEMAAIKSIKLPVRIIEILKQEPQVMVGNYSRYPFYSKDSGIETSALNTNILNLIETQINTTLLSSGIIPFENNSYYNSNYLNNYKNTLNFIIYDVKKLGFVFQSLDAKDSLIQRKLELSIQFRVVSKAGKIEIITPFEYFKIDTLTKKEFQLLNAVELGGNTFNNAENPNRFRTGETFVDNPNHVLLNSAISEKTAIDTVTIKGTANLMFEVPNSYTNYTLYFANGKDLAQFTNESKKEDVLLYLKGAIKTGKIKSMNVRSEYTKTNITSSNSLLQYYFNLSKNTILEQLDDTDILYVISKAKLVCTIYKKPNGELLITGNGNTSILK